MNAADHGSTTPGHPGMVAPPLTPADPDQHGVFRPAKDPLDDDQFCAAVRELITNARGTMDSVYLPAVRKSWKYYRGEVDASPAQPTEIDPLSGEIAYEGSRVVMTECRDAVQTILPDLLRVFLATERPVEYAPQSAEDVEGAEQATDYSNYVFRQENDGENMLVDIALDWSNKFCALKTYWLVEEKREQYPFSGLDDTQISALHAESQAPESEIASLEAEPYPGEIYVPQPQPDGSLLAVPQPAQFWKGHVVRVLRTGRERIELVPQEEFLIDGDAASADDAVIIGQDCDRLVSDVVALGVPYDQVRPYIGQTRQDRTGIRLERTDNGLISAGASVGDTAIQYVHVTDCTVRLDRDGDGIAERYRVLAIGMDAAEIVYAAPDDDVGWIVASPFRLPHQPIGHGIVEQMTDSQDQGTAVLRGVLNSLSRSINPREIVNDDEPRTYDDLRSWFGGPIRASRPGAVEVHALPFTGQYALPILDLLDRRRARRTGISDASQGLDPDVLKGQTVQGAHAVITAPQSRQEFLVREFGNGVIRPIFKHILALATRYQDKAKVIRLRNKWVPVDPRSWNAGMDAYPRVGLGSGSRGEQYVGLMMVLAKQEQLLATNSPLVTLAEYRNTLVHLCEVVGLKDVSRYFADIDDQKLQLHAQQQEQQKQQALGQQVQAAAAIEGAKAQARGQATTQSAVQVAQITAAQNEQTEAQRVAADQAAADRQAQLDASLQSQQQYFQAGLQRQKLDQQYEIELMKLKAAKARQPERAGT